MMLAVSVALAGAALPEPRLFAQQAETDALAERVRLWMSRERLDLAREAIDRLILVAPGHPAALAALAEIELRSGNVDAATATLARLRSSHPGHPGIMRVETLIRLEGPDREKLREARLLARAGRLGEALQLFRALLPNGPPSGAIALEYWDLVASSPDGWEAAREGLARLTREYPESERYRLALVEHEISRRPIQPSAIRTLIALTRVPALSRQARAAWRRALLRLDAEPATIPWLREYLSQDADDTAVRERLDAVLAEVEAIRRRDADPAYQDGRRGLAALERGDLAAAERYLARSIAGRPQDADVVGGMGLLRLRQGRHGDARTHFEQAAKLSEGESKWRDLARTALFWGLLSESREALRAGGMQRAERAAREALRLEPRHADALIALGEAQAGRGQTSEAESSFRAALGIDPASASAVRALAALYAGQQDLSAFERLVRGLAPGTRAALGAEIASLRARLLRSEADRLIAAERVSEAVRALQYAIEADPDDPWLRFDLARLHLRRGEPGEARALLENLVGRRPQHAESLHAFAQILSEMNEDATALAMLGRIPPAARSDSTNALARRLTVRTHLQSAAAHASAGDRAAAMRHLRAAEFAAEGDAQLVVEAVSNWIAIGELDEARRLLDQAEAKAAPADRPQIASRLASLRAEVLQAEAERLTEHQRIDEAIALLEQAVTLDDRRPWLAYYLARLHMRQGNAGQGLALLESQVERNPNDADALHALALYRSHLEDDLPALATLERIPSEERSDGMVELQRRVWLRAQTSRAQALRQAGDPEAGANLLARAQAAVAGDLDLTLSVASAWIDAGEPERARRLMDAIPEQGDRSPTMRLRYARLLARGGFVDDLPPLLDAIEHAPDLNAEERSALGDLREEYAVARADELLRLGMPEKALATLRARGDGAATSPRLIRTESRVLRAMNRPHDAMERYRQILALHPDDDDARLALADTLVDIGDDDAARAELETLLARSPHHPGALESLGLIEHRAGRIPTAVEHLQRSLGGTWEARAASGTLGELSMVHATRAAATGGASAESTVAARFAPPAGIAREAGYWAPYRRLADMLDRSTPWVSLGVDARFRSGAEGLSQIRAWEIPLEWKGAWRAAGRPFARTDLVQLDAGTLDLANARRAREFGSVLLCQPTCSSGAFRQSETGVSLLVGYETERLRLDIGTTPLGFPVQRLAGGVRYKGALGSLSYSIDASSRPVTSSLLSFAGTSDPRTGTVWGGVQASGVRFNLSRDQGGALGVWSLVDAHRLTGKNVQSNNRFRLMAGGYWRIINTDNRLLSVGLTGMVWRFSENAGEFTFGHGGYYSPQRYRSVSLPVTFGERTARFSYMLRAAVSRSSSDTDPAPFYPTDAGLQASAAAQAGVTGIDPRYAGGPGGGSGYSAAAAFEYQVRPSVFFGARVEIERSRNFEPNRAMVYFRIALDRPAAGPVSLIPTPVVPSSEL